MWKRKWKTQRPSSCCYEEEVSQSVFQLGVQVWILGPDYIHPDPHRIFMELHLDQELHLHHNNDYHCHHDLLHHGHDHRHYHWYDHRHDHVQQGRTAGLGARAAWPPATGIWAGPGTAARGSRNSGRGRDRIRCSSRATRSCTSMIIIVINICIFIKYIVERFSREILYIKISIYSKLLINGLDLGRVKAKLPTNSRRTV